MGAGTSAQPRTGFPPSRQGPVNVAWMSACFASVSGHSGSSGELEIFARTGRSSVFSAQLELQGVFSPNLYAFDISQLEISNL
jgi:hypothetical protein